MSPTFTLSPNPASGSVEIKTDTLLANYNLRLLSAEGHTIVTYSGLTGNSFRLNTTSLAAGLYFVELYNQDVCIRAKLFKETE